MGSAYGNVLTIDDLSNYLKISKSTLYLLVRQGQIPSQKIGRHWRFSRIVIDSWLQHNHKSGKLRSPARLKGYNASNTSR